MNDGEIQDVVESAYEHLENLADNTDSIVVVEGAIDADNFAHTYLALIDRISGEVLIMSAGYSE